ncbi:MAG: hypothetical protein WC523_04250 [Patescibacteria group bacterium]
MSLAEDMKKLAKDCDTGAASTLYRGVVGTIFYSAQGGDFSTEVDFEAEDEMYLAKDMLEKDGFVVEEVGDFVLGVSWKV